MVDSYLRFVSAHHDIARIGASMLVYRDAVVHILYESISGYRRPVYRDSRARGSSDRLYGRARRSTVHSSYSYRRVGSGEAAALPRLVIPVQMRVTANRTYPLSIDSIQ